MAPHFLSGIFGKSEEEMKRFARITISILALMITAAVVTINFNTALSFVAMLLASGALFYFIYCTDGLFTGYLETLNSNVESATTNVAQMIRSAKSSVKIVSSTLAPVIYCDHEVYSEIESARNRGVAFDIIISGQTIPLDKVRPENKTKRAHFYQLWQMVNDGMVRVNCYDGEPQPHFMVVDNLHTRIEEKHNIVYNPKSETEKRRAKTHLLNPKLAKKYSKKFDEFKILSKPYHAVH